MPSTRSSSATERWLFDIRDNITLAQRFTTGLGYPEFRDSHLAFYAVTRCLEIISEASCRLPSELKARHPGVPWIEIAAAGNVYRHDYEDVQQRLVWGTVHNRLPELLAAIERGLPISCDAS